MNRSQTLWRAVGVFLLCLTMSQSALAQADDSAQSDDGLSFRIARVLPSVSKGLRDALELIEDDEFYPFLWGERVVTGDDGQAHLRRDRPRCDLFIWNTTDVGLELSGEGLTAGEGLGLSDTTREAATNGINLVQGVLTLDQCKNIIVQTPNSTTEARGTWFSVTYLPEFELTLLVVLEGHVRVRPVRDFETGQLGPFTFVGRLGNRPHRGFFWLNAPAGRPRAIAGELVRTQHALSELPAVLEELGLEHLLDALEEAADRDGVPFVLVPPEPPNSPPLTED